MNNFLPKGLTGKMTALLCTGVLGAAILFLILSGIFNYLLDSYFFTSSYVQNASADKIESLQNYVMNEAIAATDTEELRIWAKENHVSYFTISRKRMLLYDNSYTGEIPLEQTESQQLHYTWQYFQKVLFADGEADVLIYENYSLKFYLVVNVISIVASSVFCLMVFWFGIRKEVHYIQELNERVAEIEKGQMDNEFPIKGKDEITDLAYGLDHMRKALIEKEEKEKNMKKAQEKLVIGMAHDLRTPLTSLMTYLEIIKRQNQDELLNGYLQTVFRKVLLLRNLSDQLFEFFLVNSEQIPEMKTTENPEYPLGDYLSELYVLLEDTGFQVVCQDLHWQSGEIQFCPEYLGRIMNNLLSNIEKYAKPQSVIRISSICFESAFGIAIQNEKINSPKQEKGTGIGVENIRIMMRKMGGFCEVKEDDKKYLIVLWFTDGVVSTGE